MVLDDKLSALTVRIGTGFALHAEAGASARMLEGKKGGLFSVPTFKERQLPSAFALVEDKRRGVWVVARRLSDAVRTRNSYDFSPSFTWYSHAFWEQHYVTCDGTCWVAERQIAGPDLGYVGSDRLGL